MAAFGFASAVVYRTGPVDVMLISSDSTDRNDSFGCAGGGQCDDCERASHFRSAERTRVGADVPAATAEVDAESRRVVLATPLSAILRARGELLAPLLQELIVPTYERLFRFYAGKRHLTDTERAALDTNNFTVCAHAHYPEALLRDIADLVTGHWGHVLGRIGPKAVKSCLQHRMHRGDGAGS